MNDDILEHCKLEHYSIRFFYNFEPKYIKKGYLIREEIWKDFGFAAKVVFMKDHILDCKINGTPETFENIKESISNILERHGFKVSSTTHSINHYNSNGRLVYSEVV